jgi:hypothetical protein
MLLRIKIVEQPLGVKRAARSGNGDKYSQARAFCIGFASIRHDEGETAFPQASLARHAPRGRTVSLNQHRHFSGSCSFPLPSILNPVPQSKIKNRKSKILIKGLTRKSAKIAELRACSVRKSVEKRETSRKNP